MIVLLSPAKRLDFETPTLAIDATQPRLLDQSALLIARLRMPSPADIASLMSLSDPLAALNHARYADWQPRFRPPTRGRRCWPSPAMFYEGLDAPSLDREAMQWLQGHARILPASTGCCVRST